MSKPSTPSGRRSRGQSAVYVITCAETGKFYVGSSVNVSKRLARHREDLRAGKHHSQHLQRAWDLYGEQAFSFDIVEYVGVEHLRLVEQEWIDRCKSADREYGYNMYPNAKGAIGWKASVETRKKLSDAHRGRKLPPEQIAKLGSVGSKHPAAKLDEWAVHSLKSRLIAGESQRNLAAAFGVTRTTVNDIVSGRTWGHVKAEAALPRERVPATALKEAQVACIKGQLATGSRGTTTRLSRELGVGFSTIADIKKGRTWTHV